jgi:ATP-dependent DNA helicase RecQ
VVRQLLAQGLLAVEGDYGSLVLTETRAEVLGGDRQVLLRREPERAAAAKVRSARKTAAVVEMPAEAAPLFERLRAWRAGVAKEQGVPAYVVFHDATLRQIATQRPASLADLGTVSGVGENKLAKYGEGLLEVLTGE